MRWIPVLIAVLIGSTTIDVVLSFVLWLAIGLNGNHPLTFYTYGEYFEAWYPVCCWFMLLVVAVNVRNR